MESPLRIQAPPGYVAPPLQWLRGLQLQAQMHPTIVEAHAEVFMDTNVTLQKPPQ